MQSGKEYRAIYDRGKERLAREVESRNAVAQGDTPQPLFHNSFVQSLPNRAMSVSPLSCSLAPGFPCERLAATSLWDDSMTKGATDDCRMFKGESIFDKVSNDNPSYVICCDTNLCIV